MKEIILTALDDALAEGVKNLFRVMHGNILSAMHEEHFQRDLILLMDIYMKARTIINNIHQ